MGDIIKHYEKNEDGKDYCIGDLHGCYDDFQQLMDELSFDKSVDRMFSVGDLVDRGPKSLECLRLIKEPWFHCIRGNHEDLMITAVLDRKKEDLWHMNGGDWYWGNEIDKKEIIDLVKLTSHLPLVMNIETKDGRVGICHAQPPTDWRSITQDMGRDAKFELIWGRSKIRKFRDTWNVQNIDYTVHGHTPIATPISVGNSLYIDTGICFNGYEMFDGTITEGELTCIDLSDIKRLIKESTWEKIQPILCEKNRELFG